MKKTNNSKNINGKLVKESLIDYNNLAKQLKESTPTMVENLLSEQVKQAYASLLNESDDDDEDDDAEDKAYEVEEVDDTDADVSEPEDDEDEDVEDEDDSEEDEDIISDDESEDEGKDGMDSDDDTDVEVIDINVDDDTDAEDTDDDDLGQDFDKFKTSDNEYDFRKATDDELVKVYKLIKDDDCVKVIKDNDTIKISDDELGTEYLIKLDDDSDASDTEYDIELDNNMNEARIYEIALNEYDSHVGYTDEYQGVDALESNGDAETSKYGRDIDKGVPHGTSKPWAKPNKRPTPFTSKNEDFEGDMEAPIENESIIGGKHGASSRALRKFHDTNSGEKGKNPYNKHVVSRAGEYIGHDTPTNEAFVRKANKIFEDNKKLKSMLNQFEQKLQEAAVVNVNLGGIIKLISENSTSKAEKKAIIDRFTNEAHTVNESQNLYKRISNELSQKPTVKTDINEEKQFGDSKNAEVINESKFYQDESLMNSLGLMHKIC